MINSNLIYGLDNDHQKLFRFFEENTSEWFQNVLLRTIIQYKHLPEDSDELTEEDRKMLKHASITMVLFSLGTYGFLHFLADNGEITYNEVEQNKIYSGDNNVDHLLLVLYNLMDLDMKELRHICPINEKNNIDSMMAN